MCILLSGSRTPGHAEPEQDKDNARPQAPSSGCNLEISGPEIICNGQTATFKADITGNTSRCEQDPASNIQWSTTFNKLQLTPRAHSGSTFSVKAVTKNIFNGKIIAKHPCCGTAKRKLVLNGNLRTLPESSQIKAKPHGVSIKELRQLLLQTADPTFVFSRRNRRNLRQKIEQSLRTTNDSVPPKSDPGRLARTLVPQAIKKIRARKDQFRSSLRSTSTHIASSTMDVLSDDPPAFSIGGSFAHRECSCNPGNPGWSNLRSSINGTTSSHYFKEVLYHKDISLSIKNVDLSILVQAKVKLQLSLHRFAINNDTLHAKNKNKPRTTVTGTPHLVLSATGSMTHGDLVTIPVQGPIQETYELPAVQVPLSHECDNKKN
jgi:hypothetical protein